MRVISGKVRKRGGVARGGAAVLAFFCLASGAVLPLQAQAERKAPDTSRVVVLGYHRFEDPPRDPLAISSAEFDAQLSEIRARGLRVLSLEEFLAWREGRLELAGDAVLLTIDDGYNSCYHVAWPILRKHGMPFVMFVYTNYVEKGGKTLTWAQLREMSEGGASIQSHTVSHAALDVRKGRSEEEYRKWLRHELEDSRRMISERVGAPVYALAFPYGRFNKAAQDAAREAGYKLQFTVAGQKLTRESKDDELGRYVVLSGKPEIFQMAVNFGGAMTPPGVVIETTPARGAYIGDASPLISAKLDGFGPVEPGSAELWLSGFGRLPAVYDPATNTISFQVRDRLRAATHTARVVVRSGGKRLQAEWDFVLDRKMLFDAIVPENGGAQAPSAALGGAGRAAAADSRG